MLLVSIRMFCLFFKCYIEVVRLKICTFFYLVFVELFFKKAYI